MMLHCFFKQIEEGYLTNMLTWLIF